jgi:hypothetical protein
LTPPSAEELRSGRKQPTGDVADELDQFEEMDVAKKTQGEEVVLESPTLSDTSMDGGIVCKFVFL